MCDVLRCWEGTQAGPRCRPRRPLGRLGHVVRLLGVPQLFVLFASEALVVVALALEQLLKVRLAVELTLEGGEGANTAETTGAGEPEEGRGGGTGEVAFLPEFGFTVFAAEAIGMEDHFVGNQSLHRIDGLLARRAQLLLRLKAERLSTNAD